MSLRLNYVYANTYLESPCNTEMEGFEDWLHHIIEANPNMIFFFTVDSTDIWPDAPVEFEYNTVLGHSEYGTIMHTFSPKCPEGCYGQFENCSYRKKADT